MLQGAASRRQRARRLPSPPRGAARHGARPRAAAAPEPPRTPLPPPVPQAAHGARPPFHRARAPRGSAPRLASPGAHLLSPPGGGASSATRLRGPAASGRAGLSIGSASTARPRAPLSPAGRSLSAPPPAGARPPAGPRTISCKTGARVASGPGRAEPSRAGPPLTSTGLGLLRTGSRRASTPRQACSASSSGPTLSGCESATIRQGVPRCERPGSGWLPPGSMRGAAGAQPPRPYGARPPPRATLPAAAILQRADWRRATGPARPAPPFRGRRRYLGDGGWGAAGRAAAAAEMPRPPRPSARGAAHAASP